MSWFSRVGSWWNERRHQAASQEPHPDFWSGLLAALLGCAVAAYGYFFLLERAAFVDTLFLREVLPESFERVLIDLAVLGTTLLLIAPVAVAFAWADLRPSGRLAKVLLVTGSFLVFAFLITDLHVYRLHGRHVVDLVQFAAVPEGHQAGGNGGVWAKRFAAWAAQALAFGLMSLGVTLVMRRVVTRLRFKPLRLALALLAFATSLLVGPMAIGAGAGWRTVGLRERVRNVLPLPIAATPDITRRHPGSPLLRDLELAFNEIYRQRFGYLFRRREPLAHASRQPAERPNVFLIVVESLRADALSPEMMPKMHEWARAGLRRSYHLSGSNYSEAGMFTIMYGLNPLVYHAVLDSRVPPPLCEGMRALSYRCSYFTGHPTIWWRREEFLGPDTMDVHERFQEGPWSRWDQLALARLQKLAEKAPASGQFAMTFLMSTHYEYRYPPEFERFTPAAEPEVTWGAAEGKHDFEQLRNRYRNSVGFVDHVVHETISRIDTTRDYVVFTGDHAEAIGEHGRVGHGYDFSDTQVHVPFVLRGPGISAGVIEGMSLHQDIWPTIASIVSGVEPSPHDLRSKQGARQGTILAHCDFNQQEAEALLVSGKHRVNLRLDLRSPELRIRGFEDAQGVPVPPPKLLEAERQDLVAAFDRYLIEAAAPITRIE